MKITATVSGGFAGLTEKYEIDTSLQSSAATKKLEKSIEEINFFQTPENLQEELIGADMMRWKITISDGDRQHSVSFIEDGSAQIIDWKKLIQQIKALP
jgi:hypothetical protein